MDRTDRGSRTNSEPQYGTSELSNVAQPKMIWYVKS